MKVMVVGSGGRCHAIVKALSKSEKVTRIYAAPGNDGMSELATLIPISALANGISYSNMGIASIIMFAVLLVNLKKIKV